MSESELSQRAASETLPLRDAFAVLFFVSVGMLFDPAILVNDFLPVLVAVLIIVVGKSIAAFAIVRAFRHDTPTALTISASLAQIGEFSFILAGLGVSLELLPERGRDLILAGAIVSILLNPLIFVLLDRYLAKQVAAAAPAKPQPTAAREPVPPTTLSGHTVLVGHGRVGAYITAEAKNGPPFLVIEDNARPHPGAERAGAAPPSRAMPPIRKCWQRPIWPAHAACSSPFRMPSKAGRSIQQARALNANLPIIARAHSEAEVEHLMKHGATAVVMGEHEIAKAMLGFIPGAETKPATA